MMRNDKNRNVTIFWGVNLVCQSVSNDVGRCSFKIGVFLLQESHKASGKFGLSSGPDATFLAASEVMENSKQCRFIACHV